MKQFILAAALSFIAFKGFTQATVVNIHLDNGGKDAVVENGNVNANYGTASQFNVYWSGGIYRTYLQADFTSIPVNAIVTDAKLKLTAITNDFSAAQNIQLCRANSSWVETGVTYFNQPTFTIPGAAAFTTPATTGLHTLSVSAFTAHVQNMVNYPALNYGWCLKMASEAGSTRGLLYKSREATPTLPISRPYIEVTYIMPVKVDGIVSHCTEGLDNGKVSGVTYTNGTGVYSSYEWFRYNLGTVTSIETGTNFANIGADNLADGLYLLRVTDNGGNIGYKYFLVGEYGATTTVEFSNNTSSANSIAFNEDAYTESGTNANVTGPANIYFQASHSANSYVTSLLKYQVDFDPSLTFTAANLYLYGIGSGHIATSPGNNATTVSRANSVWYENLVTYNTLPAATTPVNNIGATVAGTSTVTSTNLDVLNTINYWSVNPTQNFGWRFDMNVGATTPQQARYGSYDNTTSTLRPKLVLAYTVESVYFELSENLVGSYYPVNADDILRIKYVEEYLDADKRLSYVIKDKTGATVISHTTQEKVIEYGDNREKIDVSSLPVGFYTLTVTNGKNEEWYLRFKTL